MSTNSEDPDEYSDWITQAEAARLHGVSRQAIHKLVQGGRLRSRTIGGRVFVSRNELQEFRPQPAGRPKEEGTRDFERIRRLLEAVSEDVRRDIFNLLRKEFPIHPLEADFGGTAEVVLDALARSSPLTRTMFMGVVAESAFEIHVARNLTDWIVEDVQGNPHYDYLLKDAFGAVKVQMKLQRKTAGRATRATELRRRSGYSPEMFVVETQRTRGGTDRTTGKSTRPYRFGEFDILAVSMFPSSGNWSSFMYTVAAWLVPKQSDPSLLDTYQPVSPVADDDWTDDFRSCIERLRSKIAKTIRGT